jgi:enoyl-CoA hydratase
MGYTHILFEIDESGVALVTVNRPQKLNALSREVVGELDDAFARIASDPAIRAAIVTGAGEKAFVAGADINELAALSPHDSRLLALRGQAVFRRLETCGKPTVAAVNGFALGGGMELAMACTVRFASENAKLGQPEVKLGIIPGYGGTQRLPRLVGRGVALEMLLDGEAITAAEALRIGLVNEVVAQAELMTFSRTWLAKVMANAPLALGLVMEAVDTGLNCGLEEGLRFEAAAFGVSAATEDRIEGTRAFLEKRPAAFKGK